jgi:transcriptional regulator with XRE-family HTH domain
LNRAFDGAEARRRRKAMGLKQEHVALHVDRSADLIGCWERGESVPSVPLLLELCDLLGCEPHDLLRPVEPAGRGEVEQEVSPPTNGEVPPGRPQSSRVSVPR